MTEIPTFTDEQIDHHLIYLDALVATKKALKESESAQRMANIAAIIRQLRGIPDPNAVSYRSGYYVADTETNTITKYARLRDASGKIGFTMSAISVACKQGHSLGARYFVSRTSDGATLLLQNHTVRPTHLTIDKIRVVRQNDGGDVTMEYTTARDFRKEYGVTFDTMRGLLTKKSGVWQDLPHHPGHRVAIWCRR